MEAIKVLIGTVTATNSGLVQSTTQEVEFVADDLGEHDELSTRNGQVTDTRGVHQVLYHTDDGRYVVSEEDWSKWQGEPTTYKLHQATLDDLGPTGRFAALGAECDLSRPLTLDEALGSNEDA